MESIQWTGGQLDDHRPEDIRSELFKFWSSNSELQSLNYLNQTVTHHSGYGLMNSSLVKHSFKRDYEHLAVYHLDDENLIYITVLVACFSNVLSGSFRAHHSESHCDPHKFTISPADTLHRNVSALLNE